MRTSGLVVLLAAAFSGCTKPPSSIVVVVSTNAAIPADVDHLDVVVARAGETRYHDARSLTDGGTRLPGTLTFSLDKDQSAGDPIEIVITASGKSGSIERRTKLAFVSERQKLLRAPLHLACLDKHCAPGSTCDDGTCISEDVDASSLPDFVDNGQAISSETAGAAGGGGTSGGTGGAGHAGSPGTSGAAGAGGSAASGGKGGSAASGGMAGSGGMSGASGSGGISGAAGSGGQGGAAGLGGGGAGGSGGAAGVSGLGGMGGIAGSSGAAGSTALGGTSGAAGSSATGGVGGMLTGGAAGSGGTAGVGGGSGGSGGSGLGGSSGPGGNGGVAGSAMAGSGGASGASAGGGGGGAGGASGCLPGTAECVGGDLHLCDPWGGGYSVIPCTGSTTCNAALRTCEGTVAMAIAGGDWNFCALLNNGSPACWGDNTELDGVSGALVFVASPVPVALTGGVELSVGHDHRCIRRADGTMACWGASFQGQLGPNPGTLAEQVVTGVADMIASDSVTCALSESGTVSCWGTNTDGQLATGVTDFGTSSPTMVTISPPAVALGGVGFPCAVQQGGSVVCWGLGVTKPMTVPGVTDAVEVANAVDDLIIRHADGTVSAAKQIHGGPWAAPSLIPGLGGKAARISAGLERCALREDGAVLCAPVGGSFSIAAGLGPGSAVEVAAGSAYPGDVAACARTTAGDTRCWGRNEHGAMGNGMPEAQKTPKQVTSVSGVQSVSLALGVSCSIDASSSLSYWGSPPAFGPEVSSPTPVSGGGTSNSKCEVSDLTNRALVIQKDGSLVEWVGGAKTSGPAIAGQGMVFSDIYPGVWDAALVDGSVVMYANDDGTNDVGVFGGAAGPVSKDAHTVIPGLGTVLGLRAHPQSYFAATQLCAWDMSTLLCWGGSNGFGELGVGDTAVHNAPVSPMGLGAVTAACVATEATCAVTGGNVSCWGYNFNGQLGVPGGNSSVPQSVPGLSGITGITCGDGHICAWKPGAGNVWCWGWNLYGQVGNNSFVDATTPQQLSGLPDVSEVFAGGEHTCAITTLGDLWCWGSSVYGEGGFGLSGFYSTPTPVLGL